jgi:lathosterol oxidase
MPTAAFAEVFAVFMVLLLGTTAVYFIIAGGSYAIFFVWLKERFFPGKAIAHHQIGRAIRVSFFGILGNAILTTPIYLLVNHGYSRVYYSVEEYGRGYLVFSVVALLLFTETLVYWIHRSLHYPFLYRTFHKYHHEFRDPTPWVSMAFHPLDSFSQGLPYHLFAFLFPIHVGVYVGCVTLVTLWTFMIHDQLSICPWSIVNYTGHHTLHHTLNKYNYGQFFTVWDRLGGTYRSPIQGREGT